MKSLLPLLLVLLVTHSAIAATRPAQFILVNHAPYSVWKQNQPETFTRESFEEIRRALPAPPGARVRVGASFIFSYFNALQDDVLLQSLKNFLHNAQETDTPVLVQLDGEYWWDARPDLWNWWDPKRPSFNPANKENVEWTSWSSEDAIKINWLNWGRQIRMLPYPNLMSPRYLQACHDKMRLLVPVVRDWWQALPADKKDLLVGIKVGWESSIGVNSFHYPNGNDLIDRPQSEDPHTGIKADELPARGVQQIGYAAVKTAGIRTSGQITEADLAEVARRHMDDLAAQAMELGLPRDKLFTHGAGWKEGELLYQSAVNAHSCPGWSFYRHANDPREDKGVQDALKRSDAPFWAATEWLFQGKDETPAWKTAMENTLADARCRYLCIFNWEGIKNNEAALEAIREVTAESVETE